MDAKSFNERLGLLLQKLRAENRMTQDELAKRTGLSRASIANMETGRQAMSTYQAYLMATAFQLMSMDALFPTPEIGPTDMGTELRSHSELSETQRQQTKALIASSKA